MFILQSFPEQISGHLPCSWVVLIEVPHDRIQRDVLLNEEMINVVTDDVVVEAAVPEDFVAAFRISVDFASNDPLERTDD